MRTASSPGKCASHTTTVSWLDELRPISLKIPDELVSRVDAVARTKQISRSALMREALEEKLELSALMGTPSLYERSADL